MLPVPTNEITLKVINRFWWNFAEARMWPK